jgi:hypothetical protein
LLAKEEEKQTYANIMGQVSGAPASDSTAEPAPQPPAPAPQHTDANGAPKFGDGEDPNMIAL